MMATRRLPVRRITLSSGQVREFPLSPPSHHPKQPTVSDQTGRC
jgi:hypothetical protein